MARIIHPTVTETHSSPQMDVGEEVRLVDSEGLKVYQYVLHDSGTGDLSPAAGNLAYYLDGTDADDSTVTMDVSDTAINHVAGIFVSAPDDGEYCFIQKTGYYATVKTNGDDDIAAGAALIGGGDGTCNSVAAGTAPTNKVLGWAVAADVDADDTVAARLECA